MLLSENWTFYGLFTLCELLIFCLVMQFHFEQGFIGWINESCVELDLNSFTKKCLEISNKSMRAVRLLCRKRYLKYHNQI